MNTYPKSHIKAALSLAVLLAVVITPLPAHQGNDTRKVPVSLEVDQLVPNTAEETITPIIIHQQIRPQDRWIHIKVKPGDNLARIFQRINLPAADLQNIIDLGKEVASLRKILPGQELSFQIGQDGRLRGIRYKKNAFDTVLVDRSDVGFAARLNQRLSQKISHLCITPVRQRACLTTSS